MSDPCCNQGHPLTAADLLKWKHLARELADLRERLAAAESREVCTVAHADEVLEFCQACKIEILERELAEARAEIAKLRATAEPLPARSCEHCGANLSAEGHEPDCVREGA